jgi:hypothetical protein
MSNSDMVDTTKEWQAMKSRLAQLEQQNTMLQQQYTMLQQQYNGVVQQNTLLHQQNMSLQMQLQGQQLQKLDNRVKAVHDDTKDTGKAVEELASFSSVASQALVTQAMAQGGGGSGGSAASGGIGSSASGGGGSGSATSSTSHAFQKESAKESIAPKAPSAMTPDLALEKLGHYKAQVIKCWIGPEHKQRHTPTLLVCPEIPGNVAALFSWGVQPLDL